MDMTPSVLGQTMNQTRMTGLSFDMTNADEEESSDGFGDLGENVLSPTVRGKGAEDRHKDCFMFRYHDNEQYKDCLIPDF